MITDSRGYSVVRQEERISIVPLPDSGESVLQSEALVRITSASVCGADMRVARGEKATAQTLPTAVTMGHEGCGIVEEVGTSNGDIQKGDFVIVLPHIHNERECQRTTKTLDLVCTSQQHTTHAGWDWNGLFTDVGVYPLANLIPVSSKQIQYVEKIVPDLGRALFTITEPLLCCLSAYELMRREMRQQLDTDLQGGRALVVGCGAIGTMHALILKDLGFDVWLHDTFPERSLLAQSCLCGGKILSTISEFDVVVVTANVLEAISLAERCVKNKGILYLFAGMNSGHKHARLSQTQWTYEQLHRLAQGVVVSNQGKHILYMGHSGYSVHLAQSAISFLSSSAAPLGRMVTGIVKGWTSTSLLSQLQRGKAEVLPEPVILSILRGNIDLRLHSKIVIVANQ